MVGRAGWRQTISERPTPWALVGRMVGGASWWVKDGRLQFSSDTTGYLKDSWGCFQAFFFLLVTKTGLLFTGRPSPSVIVARKSVLLKQTMFFRTLIVFPCKHKLSKTTALRKTQSKPIFLDVKTWSKIGTQKHNYILEKIKFISSNENSFWL